MWLSVYQGINFPQSFLGTWRTVFGCQREAFKVNTPHKAYVKSMLNSSLQNTRPPQRGGGSIYIYTFDICNIYKGIKNYSWKEPN